MCGGAAPQDTINFLPLAVSMLGMSARDPLVVFRVVCQARLHFPSPSALFFLFCFYSGSGSLGAPCLCAACWFVP